MTCRGHIKNGMIVLDETVDLPEGAEVQIFVSPDQEETNGEQPLEEMLMRYAGVLNNLPPDMARNHDHYAHGKPKS